LENETVSLLKPDGSLKANEVSQDNQCVLGKWIYGEGGKYAQLAEFKTLKAEHTRFHKAAGEVIKKADSGKDVSEEVALGGKSEFAQASTAVVSAIMAMKLKSKAAA
jgi:hypothetical protein